MMESIFYACIVARPERALDYSRLHVKEAQKCPQFLSPPMSPNVEPFVSGNAVNQTIPVCKKQIKVCL
jgi:hypothetical protein